MEDDKNCQINRRPVKSTKDICLKKPTKLQSSYKKKELKICMKTRTVKIQHVNMMTPKVNLQ